MKGKGGDWRGGERKNKRKKERFRTKRGEEEVEETGKEARRKREEEEEGEEERFKGGIQLVLPMALDQELCLPSTLLLRRLLSHRSVALAIRLLCPRLKAFSLLLLFSRLNETHGVEKPSISHSLSSELYHVFPTLNAAHVRSDSLVLLHGLCLQCLLYLSVCLSFCLSVCLNIR